MASSYDLSSLSSYIKEAYDVMKEKIYADAKTMMYVNVFNTGYAQSVKIPYMVADGVWKADACGAFSTTSDIDFGQVTISTCPLTLNYEFCDLDLRTYFLAWGMKDRNTPVFYDKIQTLVTEDASRKLDKLVWQGNTTTTGGTYLDTCDGLYATISGNSARIECSLTTTAYTAAVSVLYANIDATIDQMFLDRPTAMIGKECILYMSQTLLSRYLMKMKKSNLYNYEFPEGDGMEVAYFGMPNVKLVGLYGLEDTPYMFLTYKDNVWVAVDDQANIGAFKSWLSDDTNYFRMQNRLGIGAKFYFPEFVVTNF